EARRHGGAERRSREGEGEGRLARCALRILRGSVAPWCIVLHGRGARVTGDIVPHATGACRMRRKGERRAPLWKGDAHARGRLAGGGGLRGGGAGGDGGGGGGGACADGAEGAVAAAGRGGDRAAQAAGGVGAAREAHVGGAGP